MLSIIIATCKEPKTLKKSLDIILKELDNNVASTLSVRSSSDLQGRLFRSDSEILVVGPDEETEEVVKEYISQSASPGTQTSEQGFHPPAGAGGLPRGYPTPDSPGALISQPASPGALISQPASPGALAPGVKIKYLKDKGRGKPAALNLAFQEARGEILILTDGDVWPSEGFLKKLLEPFETNGETNGVPPEAKRRVAEAKQKVAVGAVTGRPISISPRNTMFGYWSHLLVEAAHQRRLALFKKGEYLDCSGYLYAIRKSLISNFQFPISLLSEDNYISQFIWQNGYQIAYTPEAKVYVKYPDNFKDWILQKRRSAGGYAQKMADVRYQMLDVGCQALNVKCQMSNVIKMRTFPKEIFYGTWFALFYSKNLKEFWWTILLFGARLYLWALIFWDHKILRKKFKEGWGRVESTKTHE